MELHSCRAAVVSGVALRAVAGLRRRQLTVDATGFDQHGTVKVTGVAGSVARGILCAAGQSPVVCPFQTVCKCGVKTAVVPSACAAQWRDAWDDGFFGSES
eukprot:7297360-Alexandrium_andersonii.AAC.1